VVRAIGVGAVVPAMVAAPPTIPAPGLVAQTIGPAKGNDYDKHVCDQINVTLNVKKGLDIDFSQQGIVSGIWFPGTLVLHCDNPGSVRVTARYIDAGGNKRTIHKSIRCSA
jgi:hypothetical protein